MEKLTKAQIRVLTEIKRCADRGTTGHKRTIGGAHPTYRRLENLGLITSARPFASAYYTITAAGRAALSKANGESGDVYKWTEGQSVYVVHIRRYGPPRSGWDTIAKVGRKWATLTLPKGRPERFDIESGSLDGGGWESPGRVYATEEEYREHQRRAHLWAEFTALVRGLINPPAHMTADDIQESLKRLRKPNAEDQP